MDYALDAGNFDQEIQKRNSDLVFEGTSETDCKQDCGCGSLMTLNGYINPQEGMSANIFVDTKAGATLSKLGIERHCIPWR